MEEEKSCKPIKLILASAAIRQTRKRHGEVLDEVETTVYKRLVTKLRQLRIGRDTTTGKIFEILWIYFSGRCIPLNPQLSCDRRYLHWYKTVREYYEICGSGAGCSKAG
jgi:hypothetical protein